MAKKEIVFVVASNIYFPSGIVRVSHFFPYLSQDHIAFTYKNYYSNYSQALLRWLSRSVFGIHKWIDIIPRTLFHLLDMPHRLSVMAQILFLSGQYKQLFIQKVLFSKWFLSLLSKMYEQLIFDFDDAIYLEKEKRTNDSLKTVDQVIVGSHVLFEYAKQFNEHVTLIPSSIPIERYTNSNIKNNSKIRIGWIGGDSTLKQLSMLEIPLQSLIEKQYEFEMLIAGTDNLSHALEKIPGIDLIEISKYSDEEIPAIAASLDMGVMPLCNDAREQGKCGYKLLIYMASGIPVVSSPVGEAKVIVDDNLNGFLVDSCDEWVTAFENLINDKELRDRLGNHGRQKVENSYTTAKAYALLKDILIID